MPARGRQERQPYLFKGGIGADSAWATIVRIASGGSSAVFSMTGITSGRPVILSPMAVAASSPSGVGSGQAQGFVVNSIVNNVSGVVVAAGGVAQTAPVDVAVVCLR